MNFAPPSTLKEHLIKVLVDIASLDPQTILFVLLVVVAAVLVSKFVSVARQKKTATGLTQSSTTVSIDGSKSAPVRNYISEIQGLAGRPDALLSEEGYLIPVERKPLARKMHDRYKAQLLVYMRLVEEFEGKKPPYGYLILGPNCRRFKIMNTDAEQAWLQSILDQMHAILKGAASVPTPHPRKCARCDVREHCSFRA